MEAARHIFTLSPNLPFALVDRLADGGRDRADRQRSRARVGRSPHA